MPKEAHNLGSRVIMSTQTFCRGLQIVTEFSEFYNGWLKSFLSFYVL